MKDSNKVKIDYDCYKVTIAALAEEVKKKGRKYDAIYPIPRGGYFTAIQLSQLLGIRIECDERKITDYTLVVDDICDSGKTIEKFSRCDIAVAFVKERSRTKVDYFGGIIDANDWLIFPDEHDVTVEDNIVRLLEYIGEDPTRAGLLGTPDRYAFLRSLLVRLHPKSKGQDTRYLKGWSCRGLLRCQATDTGATGA